MLHLELAVAVPVEGRVDVRGQTLELAALSARTCSSCRSSARICCSSGVGALLLRDGRVHLLLALMRTIAATRVLNRVQREHVECRPASVPSSFCVAKRCESRRSHT